MQEEVKVGERRGAGRKGRGDAGGGRITSADQMSSLSISSPPKTTTPGEIIFMGTAFELLFHEMILLVLEDSTKKKINKKHLLNLRLKEMDLFTSSISFIYLLVLQLTQQS